MINAADCLSLWVSLCVSVSREENVRAMIMKAVTAAQIRSALIIIDTVNETAVRACQCCDCPVGSGHDMVYSFDLLR